MNKKGEAFIHFTHFPTVDAMWPDALNSTAFPPFGLHPQPMNKQKLTLPSLN